MAKAGAPPPGADLVRGDIENESGNGGVVGVNGGRGDIVEGAGDKGDSGPVATSCDRLRTGVTGRFLVLDVRWGTGSKGMVLP